METTIMGLYRAEGLGYRDNGKKIETTIETTIATIPRPFYPTAFFVFLLLCAQGTGPKARYPENG